MTRDRSTPHRPRRRPAHRRRPGGRTAIGLLLVGAGLGLAGAGLAGADGLSGDRARQGELPTTYGDVPGARQVSPAPAVARPAPAEPAPSSSSGEAGRMLPAAVPTGIRAPALGVNAVVRATAARADRSLLLPRPAEVGWWAGGAAPGDARGTVVLAGHLDAADGSLGALAGLGTATAGDSIRVDTTAGSHTYRVVALRTYPRARLPVASFAGSGSPRLVLITCGGDYRPGLGYARNVVVYAVPA